MARRYLIIGLGAGGTAAAEAIRNQDPAGEITLISDDPYGYYSRPGLAYYLTGELPRKMLFPFTDADFRRLNLRRLCARVTALHPEPHQVELEDGSRLAYDRLLLATGSVAVQPPIPGVDLEGVVKLDDMTDASTILTRCRGVREAIVVGGGITALEIVEGIRARHVQTYYFLRGDRYWSNVLDETESRIVERRLEDEGVRIAYHTEMSEILGKQGRVSGVLTKDGRTFRCGLVALAIGVQPRIELAQGADLETERGIVVNEYLQSNIPDLFAAGDVAQVFDPLSGKAVLDTLWGVAVAQGRAAGLNMAGRVTPYRKSVPFNVTRLTGLTTTIIGTVGQGRDMDVVGIVRGDSETWRQRPDVSAAQSDFEVNRVRLLLGEQTLVGALIMGDQTPSLPLQQLISQQVDITPIREQLLAPTVRLGELIAQFWAYWRAQNAPS